MPPMLPSSVSAVHAEVGELLTPRALEVRSGWTCQSCPARSVRTGAGLGGLNRLKLWFKAEQMPVQGRVRFRHETEHVTCSVQLGGPWFGTGELPVTAVHAPEWDLALSPRQFPQPRNCSPLPLQMMAISVPQVVLIDPSSDSASSRSRVQCK